jgi:hypothetical protein
MWLQEFYWVPQLPTLVMSHRTKGYLYSGVTKLVSSHEVIDACVSEVTEAATVHTPSKLESPKFLKTIEKIQLAPTC